jgi:hypothetical protein
MLRKNKAQENNHQWQSKEEEAVVKIFSIRTDSFSLNLDYDTRQRERVKNE